MKKATAAPIDASYIELVRAGLITYRQLNEVHRLISDAGGKESVEEVLVKKGWVKAEQLAARKKKKKAPAPALRLQYSMDLVKCGLLTFKQLNECHQLARQSKGKQTVVDVMLSKGYVSDMQLATIPKGGERKKSKRFSSSWDLFRAGIVSLKAINECHRYVKLESPGKSLKEALLERGFVTRDQLTELDRKKQAGELELGKRVRSPFMEKYAKDLEGITPELREELRREHLESEGSSPEVEEIEEKLARGEEVSDEEGLRAAKTFLDVGGSDEEEEAPRPKAKKAAPKALVDQDELQAAKTFMDFSSGESSDEEEEEEDEDLRAAKTFIDAGSSDEEEEVEEDEDLRAAKTFIDAGSSDEEAEEEEESEEFRAAKTFMDAGAADDEEEEEAPKPAPKPKKKQPKESESSADIQAAKTFLDMGDQGEEEEEDAEEEDSVPAGGTFMDLGGGDDAPKAGTEGSGQKKKKTFVDDSDSKHDLPSTGTFMDLDVEAVKGGGGMFASDTESGIMGPGVMMNARDIDTSSRHGTEPSSGATFMDLEGGQGGGGPSSGQRSQALRDAFDRAKQGTGASGTEFDAAGKSGASHDSKAGTTSAATNKSGASATDAGSKGTTSAAVSGGTGSSTARPGTEASGASSTEADKGKKKKKKEDDDAYTHPLVGKIIGGCRIVKKLGEGGMGAVFLAEHTKLKRQSVIKVVPAHLSSNRQLIARFEREARAAALIQHPNVVNVYNVGEENGVHYIEMEYVDGAALDSQLKDKKAIDPMECVRIIKDACRGLAEAHKHQIIHRDIKPENMMLTRKGQVKIADFGLARASSEELEITKVGQILGTPAYMSPEQCEGKPTDHRCDLYSLGATLYVMITGRRPFTGSVMEIMQKHIHEEPISPREFNPEISQNVVKIILKMMAKKPEDRFQNAEDIIKAIEDFQKAEGLEALQEVQRLVGTDYKIMKKLGQGGMGAVFSARASVDKPPKIAKDRIVAVKVLNKDVPPEEVARFKREAELALEIDHENIIRVLEFKISADVNYIVMEFIEGKSVRDIIRDAKKLPAKEAVRVFREAAKGLKAAHDKQIVHRDIKPDNIMVQKDGVVKIADFGIAKHSQAQSELTQAGFIVGTPHYMSPEQCGGKGEKITSAADIYAFGATLYFMVTGQKPFEGDTQMAIINQHLNNPPKPPRELVPELEESLNNVILNMMAKKAKFRYQTIDEIVKDLDAIERGKTVKKRRNIDASYEDQGRGKKAVFAFAAFAVVMIALLIVGKYAADESARGLRTRTREGMGADWQTAATKVREIEKRKAFGEADRAAADALTAVKSKDYTNGELFAELGLQKLYDQLAAELKTQRKVRDDASKSKLEEGQRTAKRGASELAAEETDAKNAVQHHNAAFAAYGDAYEIANEVLTQFGDAPERGAAGDLQRQVVQELKDTGIARLSRKVAQVNATLVPRQFFGSARRQISEFKLQWERLKWGDAAGQVLALEPGAKAADEIAKLEAQERDFVGDTSSIRDAFERAYEYEQNERARTANQPDLLPNYVQILIEYGKVREEANKDAAKKARSKHAGDAEIAIRETEKARDDEGEKRLNAMLESARRLVTGENKDKPLWVSAMRKLEEARKQIRSLYAETDAGYGRRAQTIDDAVRDIGLLAGGAWRERRGQLEVLGWRQRRFLDVAAACRALEADEEWGVVPILEPKTEKTLRQLAVDFLAEVEGQLLPLSDAAVNKAARMLKVDVRNTEPQVGGEDPRFPNERPRHLAVAVLGKGRFWLDKTEVRVSDYQKFLNCGRDGRPTTKAADQVFRQKHDPVSGICPDGCPGESHEPPDFDKETNGELPVTNVTWFDASAYAAWAGKRLPTEEEWEVAASWDARRKVTRFFPWGDEFTANSAATHLICDQYERYDTWFGKREHPGVGTRPEGAGPYGHLDLAGSVWEWTSVFFEAYKDTETGKPFVDAQKRPVAQDGDFGTRFRVIRGGSFQNYVERTFHGAYRFKAAPAKRQLDVGFRCARDYDARVDGP